jgi:hypothetical protein
LRAFPGDREDICPKPTCRIIQETPLIIGAISLATVEQRHAEFAAEVGSLWQAIGAGNAAFSSRCAVVNGGHLGSFDGRGPFTSSFFDGSLVPTRLKMPSKPMASSFHSSIFSQLQVHGIFMLLAFGFLSLRTGELGADGRTVLR